jgi:hypothetical protein
MDVDVTWNEKGFVATAPELRQPIVALSLGGVKQRFQAIFPHVPRIDFHLDKSAQAEVDDRRRKPETKSCLP